MKSPVAQAYIREYCTVLKCGGRVHRHVNRFQQYADDSNGSEVVRLEIFDQCDTCRTKRQAEASIHAISDQAEKELQRLFARFEDGEISRAEFDNLIGAFVENHGAIWKIAAS